MACSRVDDIVIRAPTEYRTQVDVSMPNLVGYFLDNETIAGIDLPVIVEPRLDATFTASDAGVGGIERLVVYLQNQTTNTVRWWYHSGGLNGPPTSTASPQVLKPMLDARYALIGYAKDRAGNVRNDTLATVEVRVRPSVELTMPPFEVQSAGFPKIRGNVSVDGYPNATANESWIRVSSGSNVILNETVAGTTSPAVATWNASASTSGAYKARVDSFRRWCVLCRGGQFLTGFA